MENKSSRNAAAEKGGAALRIREQRRLHPTDKRLPRREVQLGVDRYGHFWRSTRQTVRSRNGTTRRSALSPDDDGSGRSSSGSNVWLRYDGHGRRAVG